jgi:hypothetical protein
MKWGYLRSFTVGVVVVVSVDKHTIFPPTNRKRPVFHVDVRELAPLPLFHKSLSLAHSDPE